MIKEHSHDYISEITEITVASVLDEFPHFSAAIGWGSLIGTVCLLGIIAVIEGFDIQSLALLWGLLLFGLFVAGFTLAGMVAIGLPITLILRQLDWELAWLYSALGAISGFLFLAIIFGGDGSMLSENLALTCPGAVAGFVTALRWGLWREKRATIRLQAQSGHAPARRDNPIHDLIY